MCSNFLLSHKEKVKDIMLTPIAGEITEREPYNGYLIYQGGIPEVEEFLRTNLIVAGQLISKVFI